MLKQAIEDYLLWMIITGYTENTIKNYERILNRFFLFTKREKIPWRDIFSFDTIESFHEESRSSNVKTAIKRLSEQLFEQKKIHRPFQQPHKELPDIYEQYLVYYAKVAQVKPDRILQTRSVLNALKDYLDKQKTNLANIKIEQLDAFLAESYPHLLTRQCQRSCLRGFIAYLHHERRILKRDLASLLIGAPLFAQSKPPKFLRAHEVQELFSSIDTSSSKGLRSYAMLLLAFTLGLRPVEISLIRLDDIFFCNKEIIIRNRKGQNPIKLPLSDNTIRAISTYIMGARPKSRKRILFFNLIAPYGPISRQGVSMDIRDCMKKANLQASAYWLRHTYAKSLLENGASIFEIKEMLGHNSIQNTWRYIHIHIELMRKVIFNETL